MASSRTNQGLLKALDVAARHHKTQTRKYDGAPYINHLIEVASLLAEVAKVDDQELLQAAILHDILEDTDVSEELLQQHFTERTLGFVRAVSDDKSLILEQRREAQIRHLGTAQKEVKLLKLADQCSNIAAIPASWTAERVAAYMVWSENVAQLCFDASEPLAEEYRRRLKSSPSYSGHS